MSYPWQHIDPKDQLMIQLSQPITEADTYLISTLYKPLMSGQAVSLYLSLKSVLYYSPKASSEILVSRLLSENNIGIEAFFNARSQLEALGLLDLYQHKHQQHQYIYQVHPPLSASEFFSDPILRTLLYQQIGESHYDMLKHTLLQGHEISDQFRNITKSFLDVYHYNGQVVSQEPIHSPKQPAVKDQVEAESDFDWQFFKQGLSQHFVKVQSITSEIRQLIAIYHVTYGIDEQQMQQIILETADVETGNVDVATLERNLNRKIQQLNRSNQLTQKSQAVTQATESDGPTDEALAKQGFSPETIESIQVAYAYSPLDYLESIKQQRHGFVTSSEKWTIKELVSQSRLTAPVINILLSYILIIKDNPTLEKNYALKIANDWAQKGIRTPEEAMKLIYDLYRQQNSSNKPRTNKSHSSYKGTSAKRESLPDWVSNPIAEEERLSPEKEAEMRQKLQQISHLTRGES
ncbi:replication initiation and membrane attachment family protein [Dolosigranulum pigrum]|uniref:replication initiation and membrane attachment family protein n=1 Tax=Dolosigranulum pigrum TaxID=29394 RepID=UPI001919B9E3|nr:DnaD domain protein [Dolosigranulum pigrum]